MKPWQAFLCCVGVVTMAGCASTSGKPPAPSAPVATDAFVLADTSLADRWQQEILTPQEPTPLKQYLASRQVIWVGGIFNGLQARYFEDNVHALKNDLGIKDVATLFPFPFKGNDLATSADWLYPRVKRLYETRQKPILLIGHSKGGVDSLMLLMRHPELFQNGWVEKLVLVQSPVQGSPAADWTEKHLPCIFRHFEKGLASLKEDQTPKILAEALAKLSPQEREMLRQRTFFIRSQAPADEMIYPLSMMGRQLPTPNDGMVPTENMKDDAWGTDLGVIKADHLNLMSGTKYGWFNNYVKPKKAFTRTLFWELMTR